MRSIINGQRVNSRSKLGQAGPGRACTTSGRTAPNRVRAKLYCTGLGIPSSVRLLPPPSVPLCQRPLPKGRGPRYGTSRLPLPRFAAMRPCSGRHGGAAVVPAPQDGPALMLLLLLCCPLCLLQRQLPDVGRLRLPAACCRRGRGRWRRHAGGDRRGDHWCVVAVRRCGWREEVLGGFRFGGECGLEQWRGLQQPSRVAATAKQTETSAIAQASYLSSA